ncbi:hypothetical protein KAURM247S_05889 [Kitasatospora aureofaciens]
MSVYVGIDVHRKRSQIALVGQDGEVQVNRNVPNSVETDSELSAICRSGPQSRSRPPTDGAGWSNSWRTTDTNPTSSTLCSAKRSPPPG